MSGVFTKSYELMQIACSPCFLLNLVKIYPTQHKMVSAARLYAMHGYNVTIKPMELRSDFTHRDGKIYSIVIGEQYELTLQKYLTDKELKRFERRYRNGLRNTVSKQRN